MNRHLIILEKLGFVFTVIVGTALHFAFEKSGNNSLVGLISPINESVWEHLKLILTPYIIFMIVELFILKNTYESFFPTKMMGLVLGMITTIILFYTYTGIIGNHILWVDIVIFVISVAVAYGVSYYLMVKSPESNHNINIISAAIIVFIVAVFIIYTISPPKLPLFLDGNTGRYGIVKK